LNKKEEILKMYYEEQLKDMLGIGVNLAYKLVRNKIIPSIKVGREYKIPKRNIIFYLTNQN
jgi:excisionase family DNA binding protein